jgi:flagellin
LSSGQLTDADTGAIGGSNASGGPVRNAASVVEDSANRSGEDQLEGFAETWEKIAKRSYTADQQSLQVGSEVGQTLDINSFQLNGGALNIMDSDVTGNANAVIAKMDRALDYVNARRADIGAQLGRLDSTVSSLAANAESTTSSRSRIQDTDYAKETANLTRAQILQRASTAIVAQANSIPRIVLSLLR